MPINWNDDQLAVIRHREGNLLVSAAAGSGKTAVMIERLVRMITDPEDAVDVEELLVVTFTNAAAAQMRDKLYQRLHRAMEQADTQEESARLLLQLRKLKSARIMTIHAFCQQIIHDHITRIEGLDPGFRVADETEAQLIRSDVLEEVLESCYADTAEAPESGFAHGFSELVDRYSGSRQDSSLADLIEKITLFMNSLVDPEGWMEQAVRSYDIDSCDDLPDTPWYPVYLEEVRRRREDAACLYRQVWEAYQDAGCTEDHPAFQKIDHVLAHLEDPGRTAYEKDDVVIGTMDYKPWKEDPAEKKRVQDLIGQAREAAKDLIELNDWVRQENVDVMRTEILPALAGLKTVVERYRLAYRAAKQEKGVVDFADLERYALEILLDDAGRPTREAGEIRDLFRYICVDEYQDSNDVQEAILNAIARKDADGDPINIFMVGDVKQSIYKFREARPELFLEKQERYPHQKGASLIFLHQNYRSRPEILRGVNTVFRSLMYKPDGEIEYNDDEALVPGADFTDPETGVRTLAGRPELIRILQGDDIRAREAEKIEVMVIAQRIKTLLMSGLSVFEDGAYRPLTNKDIAVLFRTPKTMAPLLLQQLKRLRVPAFSEITAGFYQTKEIQCIVNLLKIIDNPQQDIPLTGALYSPIYHFSGQELAWIRREAGRDVSMYEALKAYQENGRNEEIRLRVSAFLSSISAWQEKAVYLPMHELIWLILQETGYYLYVASSEDGSLRCANLDLMLDRALAFEKGSYKGLFHFMRYLARMEEEERDEIQAGTNGDEDDVVHIMSIHKSKGLEFPVVFVGGLGHKWNRMDLSGRMLLHPELYIGAEAVTADAAFRYETLPHRAIITRKKQEMIAEEMRVLYVAMTRAKEKLILSGAMKMNDDDDLPVRDGRLEPHRIRSASNYMDWLVPILSNAPDWVVTEVDPGSVEKTEDVHPLVADLSSPVYDENWYRQLDRRMSYQYPFAWKEVLPSRLSVSQLKKTGEEEQFSEKVLLYEAPEEVTEEEERASGSRQGTAIHKVLSLLDLDRMEEVEAQLEALELAGRLTREERDMVPLSELKAFADSSLIGRMRASAQLLKEQPFIVRIPVGRIRTWIPEWMEDHPEVPEDAEIMVQGIIDVCFREEDSWVIADYKSDRFWDASRVEMYSRQLRLYAFALERITDIPVRELMLYRTRTAEEIPVALGQEDPAV